MHNCTSFHSDCGRPSARVKRIPSRDFRSLTRLFFFLFTIFQRKSVKLQTMINRLDFRFIELFVTQHHGFPSSFRRRRCHHRHRRYRLQSYPTRKKSTQSPRGGQQTNFQNGTRPRKSSATFLSLGLTHT